MADIDRLEVEVEASASKANAELDKLVGKLDKIAGSLSKITSGNLVGLANGIERLGRSVKSVSSIKTADFTRFTTGLNKLSAINVRGISDASRAVNTFTANLSQIGNISIESQQFIDLANAISKLGYKTVTQAVSNIPQLAEGIQKLVIGLNRVGTISFDMAGLSELVSSVTKLGYKSSTNAIPNIQELGIALKELITTLSKVPQVSGNVIALTNALANLTSNGNRVSKAAEKLSGGLDSVSSSAGKAGKSTSSITFGIGKMYLLFRAIAGSFGQIKEAIDISSDLTEVQNVVDVTFGNMKQKIEDFASTSIRNFGMSELTAKQISSRFQAMGVAMGFTQGKMSDMSVELTKLAADMASFYNVEQTDVAESLESIFTGQTRPLRTYGLDLTQATLQEWAMKQGLDADIQSMSQAEKTMLRYQYVMANTTAAQGDFTRTEDTWANQTRILSQQLQALASVIGGVLINALKPFVTALNNVMAKVIQFAQTVANALGSIFGWTIEIDSGGMTNDFSDMADSTEDTAGNLGNAANAAKKLKNYVLGFDQLNILGDNQDDSVNGGSGSGTGIGGAGAGNANLVKVESALDKYKSEIENLYQLGEYIGQALTDAMNSIDWDAIYAGARDFGIGLADFLNGLISPELFGAVGRTIAGSLNTAIYVALSFGETFDWEDFGLSIAEGINEFFRTFDFKSLAKTINVWVHGIKETIAEAIDNIDFGEVTSGIYDFFSNLEIDTVVLLIGAFTLKYAGKRLTSKELQAVIAGKIFSLLSGSFAITLPTLFINVVGFGFAANPIAFSEAANKLLDGISEMIDMILPDWAFDLLSKIGAGLVVGATLGAFGGSAGMIAGAITGAITEAFANIKIDGKSILHHIFDPIFNWDSTFAVLDEARKNFEKGGFYIILGVIDGLLAAVGFLVEPIGDFFKAIWDGICEVFGIHSPADAMKPLGQNIFLGIVEGFKGAFGEFYEAFNEWWSTQVAPWFTVERWLILYDSIKSSLMTKWSETSGEWKTNIQAWWSGNVAPWFTVERWLSLYDTVKTSLRTKWNEASSEWKSNINDWWNNNVTPWFTASKWLDAMSGIKEGFKESFKNAANAAIDVVNRLIRYLNEKLKIEWDGFTLPNGDKVGGFSKQLFQIDEIAHFASGGYPETGQLFLARENGINEMIGRIGSRSAVANNDQIVEAVSAGVSNAMMDVMMAFMGQKSESAAPVNEFTFKVDSETLYKIVKKGEEKYDRRYHVLAEF